jgi:CubicO group peptidase (beta-lactamase class C family)
MWIPLGLLAVHAAEPSPADIAARVQPVIDALALYHNVSFSAAIRTRSHSTVLFSGDDDRSAGEQTKVSATTRFPMGSVTKSWTAAAIMRLKDQGRIDIDLPISHYIDPVLQVSARKPNVCLRLMSRLS